MWEPFNRFPKFTEALMPVLILFSGFMMLVGMDELFNQNIVWRGIAFLCSGIGIFGSSIFIQVKFNQ